MHRPEAALAVGALAMLLRPAASQICNSADPESGGLWIPALGTGGAKVRRGEASQSLALRSAPRRVPIADACPARVARCASRTPPIRWA